MDPPSIKIIFSSIHSNAAFVDAQFVDFESGREELKKRIWEKYKDQYKIDLDSLKYTDEIISKAEGKKYKYNVIVLPHGDSDISAQRQDVRISFLLEH